MVNGIVKLVNDITQMLETKLNKSQIIYYEDNQNKQILIKDINDLFDHVKLIYDTQFKIGKTQLISVMKNSIDMVDRVVRAVNSLTPTTDVEKAIVSGLQKFLELGSALLKDDLKQVENM